MKVKIHNRVVIRPTLVQVPTDLTFLAVFEIVAENEDHDTRALCDHSRLKIFIHPDSSMNPLQRVLIRDMSSSVLVCQTRSLSSVLYQFAKDDASPAVPPAQNAFSLLMRSNSRVLPDPITNADGTEV